MSSQRPTRAPSPGAEYGSLADIYEIWTDSAAAASANRPFYVDAYLAADGPVVELGVGDGRIAVEAATRGGVVTCIDQSSATLERRRQRAQRAEVDERLTLLQEDFRDFALEEPAALIALPCHSLGHLATMDDRRMAIFKARLSR